MSFRLISLAALAFFSAMSWATAPFDISELQVDLPFAQALEKAKALGGDCTVEPGRLQDGGVIAKCEYLVCVVGTQAGVCEERTQEAAADGFAVAGQPVLRVSLEAPDESARLVRIVLLLEGLLEPVAEHLVERFGPPDQSGTPSDEQSWSHSRRLGWTQENYRMGLLNTPRLIILAVDRPQTDAGEVAAP
jgi:hypothetical protein